MTTDEAVEQLDALLVTQYAGDEEVAHDRADKIVLECVPQEVREAYERLVERARYWAYA